MAENITGIRYIGNKPVKTDNVANTGATWQPQEVVNFSSSIAALLLVHVGVFEMADVNPNGATFMGGGKKVGGRDQEPIAFANINDMDVKQLDAYSRLNFNRGIDLTANIEVSRNIVISYMTSATLDEEAERVIEQSANNGNKMIALEVGEAEYEAYLHGILELRLVPVKKPKADFAPIDVVLAEERAVLIGVAGKTPEAPASAAPTEALPTLPELLASLNKKDLITLAKENKIGVSNTMTEEKLREKLLRELVTA